MKLLKYLLGIFYCASLSGQTYEMDEVDGTTVSTCSGTFFDSQSISANGEEYYNVNENYSVTFCSDIPGDQIRVDFSSIGIIPGQDTLWVYDGPNSSSNLIAYYSGYYNAANANESVLSSQGCLTFVFKSTGNQVSVGWEAVISCINVPPIVTQPACTNIGFDQLGPFYNANQWYSTVGTVSTGIPGSDSPKYVPNSFSATTGTHNLILFGNDPFAGFNAVSPFNPGTASLRLGDVAAGANGASTEQKFMVTNSNALYVYSYAVVIENALDGNGNPHPPEQQPFFKIEALDCNDQPIECAEYLVVGGPNIPGFLPSNVPNIFYKPWSQVMLDLSPYIGSCVTVRFTAGDCTLGGHRAYAYIDGYCSPIEINAPDTICPGETVLLEAPPGGASYYWSPTGDTTQTISVSPETETIYECTIMPFNNGSVACPSFLRDTINVYETFIEVDSSIICEGEIAVLTAVSSVLGGSYSWSPGGQTTESISISPSSTSTYTCTYTDPSGCVLDTSGIVYVDPIPILSSTSVSVCFPDVADITTAFNDQASTIGTVTYWEDASATIPLNNPTNLSNSGTYYIVKETNEGCSDTVSISVEINPLPIANAGSNDTVCNSLSYLLGANSTTGLGIWGSSTNTSFNTNVNDPNASITVLNEGEYSYVWTITENGCSSSDTVDIYFSNLSFVDNVTPSNCGNNDGEIEILASNGQQPYEYSIDGGGSWQSTGDFTNLNAGNYNVVIRDSYGCVSSATIQVTNTGGPTIDGVLEIDVSCNGECNGSISINSTGGVLFSLDSGINMQPSNVFSNLCPGVYNLLVEDSFGCRVTGVAIIEEPLPISIGTTVENLVCYQECSGSVDVLSQGGTGMHEYSIDNGQTYSANSLFSNQCAGNYLILVKDSLGCLDSIEVNIIEPSELTATLGGTDASCAGVCDGTISVTVPNGSGTAPYGYNWTGLVTGQNSPYVTGVCSGNYLLTITDDNGCTYQDSIEINGPNSVTIDSVSIVNEDCFNSCSGIISVFSAGASSFSIDGISFIQDSVFTNLCSGNYIIYASNPNGCLDSITAVVNGPAPMDLSIIGDSYICLGATGTLEAIVTGGTAPYTYQWSDSQGNSFNTQTINVNPLNTSVFNVIVTDDNGCTSSLSYNLVVGPPLNVIAFSDVSICLGDSASISAVGSGGDGGPYNYLWDNGIGVGQFQTVAPTSTTTYMVTVSDNCGTPVDTSSVTVTIIEIPEISFTADTLEGCVPILVNFQEMGVPIGSNCIWRFEDGGVIQGCDNIAYNFTEPGCWDVELSIITPEGCLSDYSELGYVCVYPYPIANFNFSPSSLTVYNTQVQFENESEDANSYLWLFDEEATSTLENPSYEFPNDVSKVYETCLIAENLEGCVDTICHNIEIEEEAIVFVPNSFTPDGKEPNNVFIPVVGGVNIDDYELLIFNRWGELLLKENDPNKGWDGTYKGVMAQIDTYVWKLNVMDDSGRSHEYIGHVNLIR